MVLPRTPHSLGLFRAQACSTTRGRVAGRHWQKIGRRFYATEQHQGAKKGSSDLPWIIGSTVVTVPAAAWLIQQNPKRKRSGHDHGAEEHEKHEGNQGTEPQEEKEETISENDQQSPEVDQELKEDVGIDQGEDEEPDSDGDERPLGEKVRKEPPNELGGAENKFTSNDEGLEQDPDDSLHKSSQQIKAVDPEADEGKKDEATGDVDKGHEGEQKGSTVTKQDQDRKSDDAPTNSLHPYMADEKKSKKSEGVVETAKLTGTVDSGRKLR